MSLKAKFTKNDQSFICICCGEKVNKLKYSSRDHCPKCLASVHIDIFPGDRANDCKGILKPIGVKIDGKKGYIIQYKCEKCGKLHNNRAAADDDIETIISLTNNSYNKRLAEIIKFNKIG